VPTYRSDLEAIPIYRPGRPIEEVTRELGIESLDKLASNECPESPFPEVIEAIAASASTVNRYPDSAAYDLTQAIATHHGVAPENVWVGAGSSEVLRCSALAVGGPGTSAVFADPSFVMYRIATMVAGAVPIAVPLTDTFDHDVDGMIAAIQKDTTIVYVCNPNNPTGGYLSGSSVSRLIDAVPSEVLVVVDEAYAEYVTAHDYRSLLDEATGRENLLVTRTFSKIYGLAGLRVGYGIGSGELISSLSRTQAPFSVTSAGQSAALEALKHQSRVTERRDSNAAQRASLVDELRNLGLSPATTQANFVYFEPHSPAADVGEALLRRGEIIRVLGDGIRVTVGTPEENARFIDALSDVVAT